MEQIQQGAGTICPRFEKAMNLLSKRWAGLIIFQLMQGTSRFCAIEAALPNISGRLLSERLKDLEQEGIVRRDVYPETPVRIEYSLTDKGRALQGIFAEVAKWSAEWLPEPERASGAGAEPASACAASASCGSDGRGREG